MIGEYLMKAKQGSQFRRFRHKIIGIHENEISSYNAFGRSLIE